MKTVLDNSIGAKMKVIKSIAAMIAVIFAMGVGSALAKGPYRWIILPLAACYGIGWLIWRIKTPKTDEEKEEDKKKFDEMLNKSKPIM